MGKVTKNYISSINLLDDREIMRDVLDVTSEDRNILDIMEMTGRQVQTDEPEYHNHSNQYRFTSAVIAAIDVTKDGTTGQNILIDVADAATLPVVGEIAMFPAPAAGLAKVISVGVADGLTSVQFEAEALDGGTGTGLYEINPTSAVAVSDVVTFPTAAYAEGSFAPEGKKPKLKQSSNYVQIFKTSGKVTDMQKVSALTVNYGGSPHILYKIQHDTLMSHRDKIAYGLLIGRKSKTTNANDENTYTTQGLINYIKYGDGGSADGGNGGIVKALGGSAITKPDFREVSRKLDKRGAPSEYWLWAGGDFVDSIEDYVHGTDTDRSKLLVQNGGSISYNSFGSGDGQARAFDLGVDSFRMGGRAWHMKKLNAFDHPEVFAASDAYKFGGMAFAIPTGKIKADLSGATKERLQVRYSAGDGTDLRYLETLTGALAPTPTSTEAALEVAYESVMGLEACGIDHFACFTE